MCRCCVCGMRYIYKYIYNIHPHTNFSGMPKAREMLFVADHLTRRHLPKLHRHLMQQVCYVLCVFDGRMWMWVIL